MPKLRLDSYLTFECQQFSYRNCVMWLNYIDLLFIISLNTLAHFSTLWQALAFSKAKSNHSF